MIELARDSVKLTKRFLQDNKVLPTTLLPEQARAEREWWYDPR